MNATRRVFISVCEESADLHAASLVRTAREQGQHWQFYGLTGPRLRALGVETVYDFASHAAMLGGVLGVLGRAVEALRRIEQAWRRRRPDLVVLLDSPELHLKVAARARRLGIPVLYYIAPQTWAARSYRNRQIRRDVHVLACILPFEEEYFGRGRVGAPRTPPRARSPHEEPPDRCPRPARAGGGWSGFRAEYVGHPLFEQLRRESPAAGTVEFLRRRAAGRPIVALLPGSRRHVIDALLPRQLEVVRRLRAAGHDVYAAISCVSQERREQVRELLAAAGENALPTRQWQTEAGENALPTRQWQTEAGENALPTRQWHRNALCGTAAPGGAVPSRGRLGQTDAGIDVVVADNASLLSVADLVLVASGTATLEVAYRRKPMVVMYDAGRLMGLAHRVLGRRLVTTPHLSLVNILAGARVVPEFMPVIRAVEPIVAVAGQLLVDETWRRLMVSQLDALVRPLEGSRASERVCGLIHEALGARRA